MSAENKKRLKYAIYHAFDKWAAQFQEKLSEDAEKQDIEAVEKARMEDLFLSKRVFILGFYRHVTQEAQKNADIQRQRKVILSTILKSIIDETGFTVKELEKDTTLDEELLYTRRHTQRILREVYDEVFYELEKRYKNRTYQNYSSIFSPHETPPLQNQKLLDNLIQSHSMIKNNSDIRKILYIRARIHTLLPEYVQELLDFQKDALKTTREIGYGTEMEKILVEELSGTTEILQIFFNHFQSIISVGWWRSRREKTKRKLIKDGFPWKYTTKDAAKIRQLLLELTGSEEHAFSIMFDGALALIEYNRPYDALTVFTECVSFDDIPAIAKGIIHENIATYHRRDDRSKLMISEMKEALSWYIESVNQYRVCVALKNLGEAEWMYGKREAALRYFRESEELGETLDQEEKFGVYWNLASSARRIGDVKMEIGYLSKCLVECPDDWADRALMVDKRLEELTR